MSNLDSFSPTDEVWRVFLICHRWREVGDIQWPTREVEWAEWLCREHDLDDTLEMIRLSYAIWCASMKQSSI